VSTLRLAWRDIDAPTDSSRHTIDAAIHGRIDAQAPENRRVYRGNIDEYVDEQLEERLDKEIDDAVDEDIDKDVDKDIDEDIDEDIEDL
jgi:hypothetical protein